MRHSLDLMNQPGNELSRTNRVVSVLIQKVEGDVVLSDGIKPTFFSTIAEALTIDLNRFDCVVLNSTRYDLPLIVEKIRDLSYTPLIVLLRGQEDKDLAIACINAGADACLYHPVRPLDLSAQIFSLVRREAMHSLSVAESSVWLDSRVMVRFNERLLVVEGKAVRMTPVEAHLLYHLVQNYGQPLSGSALSAKLWNLDEKFAESTLRSYISCICHKMGKRQDGGEYIVHDGRGYALKEKPVRSIARRRASRACKAR